MIAAVLLIAFTMAVASIFAQWAPQLVKNAQDDTSNKTEDISRCSGLIFDVTSGNVTHATVKQETGKEAIGDFTVTWHYTDANAVQTTGSISSKRGITTVNNSEDSSYGTLEEIEANPTACEGSSSASYTP